MPPPLDPEDLEHVRAVTGFRALNDTALCVLVEIDAACAPLTGESPKPALVFRFTHADGSTLPPIVLVFDESQHDHIVDGMHHEVDQAIAKARTIRGLS